MARQRYTVEQIIAALKDSKGLIYLAARRLGCHHSTVVRYADKYPKIRETINACRETRIDVAESKLDEAVERGEAWAVCFTLKTIGKPRGYVERQELTGKDGGPVECDFEGAREKLAQQLARHAEQSQQGQLTGGTD